MEAFSFIIKDIFWNHNSLPAYVPYIRETNESINVYYVYLIHVAYLNAPHGRFADEYFKLILAIPFLIIFTFHHQLS